VSDFDRDNVASVCIALTVSLVTLLIVVAIMYNIWQTNETDRANCAVMETAQVCE